MQDTRIEKAYRYCEAMVRNHYENFPVASWFLPRHIRRPIAVIYAFARTADDIADEGELSPPERLEALDDYDRQLEQNRQTNDPVFIALADVMQQHKLPVQLFHDLITAFKMDVTQKRYNTFNDILFYCQHSANPIGRLLVHLNNRVSEQSLQYSDAICTALQLINFYQDLEQDYYENKRIYIAQEDIQQFGVTENHFASLNSNENMQRLMQHQIKRARDMLLSGQQLGTILPGRMGFELRMVIAGGRIICDKLSHTKNVFARPRLNTRDWLKMLWLAFTKT